MKQLIQNKPRLRLFARTATLTITLAASLLLAGSAAFAAAIGVTDNGTTIVVDTHAGLVYTVIESQR